MIKASASAASESPCFIRLEGVSLEYELFWDRSDSLKERLVNLLHRRSYVEVRKNKLLALNDVNLEFETGERVGIIGLNGAGKSTLLKVVSNILKPTTGRITRSGSIQPLIEISAGFNPEFTGRDNIYLNGYMLGFTDKQIRAKEQEIIDFAELGNFIDVPVKYYSSGMSVRLAFTIATTIDPEILVFDEMLAAGDVMFKEKARQRMESLLSKAKILILVSHDVVSVRELTKRVVVLDRGQVLFDGKTEDGIQYYFDMVAARTAASASDQAATVPVDVQQQAAPAVAEAA